MIGYYDVTGRLAHHPTPTQTLGPHPRSTAAPSGSEGDQGDPHAAGVRAGRIRSRRPPVAARHAPPGGSASQAFATRETGRNLDGPVGDVPVDHGPVGLPCGRLARGWGRTGSKAVSSCGTLGDQARRPRLPTARAAYARHRGLRRGRRAEGRLPPGHLDARWMAGSA